MSLLDTILDNRSNRGGVTIVSENNDAGSINWVNGLSDPGEMIRCQAYPQLRRQVGEQDREYAARIRPLMDKIPANDRKKIMAAALARCGLEAVNGKIEMFAAGELPWHGLGTLVNMAATSAEAIKLAGLDWLVEKMELAYFWNDTKMPSKSSWSIVRKDTGVELGSVGRIYKPIQNVDGFNFLDAVLAKYGARYESAGAIYGGKQVWMLAKFPEQAFTINGSDAVEPYAIFTNPHDGHGSAYCYPTSVRVVCRNTYRNSTGDRKKGISISHMGDLKSKIEEAQEALGLAVKSFGEFKESAEAMATTKCDLLPYANDVLDACLDITQAQMSMGVDVLSAAIAKTEAQRQLEAKKIERRIEHRKFLLEDIVNRYDSERCGVGGMRGTTWAAFNAITEHADHSTFSRQSKNEHERMSRRFESTVAGDADDMKQVAYDLAVKTLAV